MEYDIQMTVSNLETLIQAGVVNIDHVKGNIEFSIELMLEGDEDIGRAGEILVEQGHALLSEHNRVTED